MIIYIYIYMYMHIYIYIYILSAQSLLTDPNPNSPANSEAALLWCRRPPLPPRHSELDK